MKGLEYFLMALVFCVLCGCSGSKTEDCIDVKTMDGDKLAVLVADEINKRYEDESE